MRHVLRLLGTRYGAALAILAVIAAFVSIGRLVDGPSRPTGRVGAVPAGSPSATTSPVPDDGLSSPQDTPSPSTGPGAPPPEAVAADFARAWLAHTGVTAAQWYDAVTRYATPTLAGKLKGVDPAGVPANALTGPVTLIPHAASYVDAQVPVDAGTLTLRVVATNGRWLVDGVDWQRS